MHVIKTISPATKSNAITGKILSNHNGSFMLVVVAPVYGTDTKSYAEVRYSRGHKISGHLVAPGFSF